MVLSFAVRLLISLALCQTCANEELLGCPAGWLEYNHHCYFFGKPTTWLLAEDDCVSRGGHLTSVLDQRENRWLTNAMKNARSWIGLRRETSGNRWQWVDGTIYSFSYWNTGEPNNVGRYEECTELMSGGNGRWNDLTCYDYRHYTCKMPFCSLSPTTSAEAATCPTPAPAPCPTTAKPATCPTPAPCPICPTTAKPATCPASPPPTNGEFQMCTSSTDESCLLAMIAIPKGGFQDVLDGLSVAPSVVIRGRPNPQAKRLVVNLDGRDPNGKKATTALQLDLDLESQTFSLNYRVGGNWGGNRTGDLPRGRPFGAGLPFKIVIEWGSGTFHLDFNDMLQLDLAGPEFDIGSINWMEVWQVASDDERRPADLTFNAASGLGVGTLTAIGSVLTCLFVLALTCHQLLSAF
ncbi:uncharacterized protein ACBT44_021340 [Syngnathus typhle]